METWHVLGHRQWQRFDPWQQPGHYLDALRSFLAHEIANNRVDHTWAVYYLAWPDQRAKSCLSFRRVLPLNAFPWASALPRGLPLETRAAFPDRWEEGGLTVLPSDDTRVDYDDMPAVDMKLSEYLSTNLATLQAIDLQRRYKIPSMRDDHWQLFVRGAPSRPPFRPVPEYFDAQVACWAVWSGAAVYAHEVKKRCCHSWSKMYDLKYPAWPGYHWASQLAAFPARFQGRETDREAFQETIDALLHGLREHHATRRVPARVEGPPLWSIPLATTRDSARQWQ